MTFTNKQQAFVNAYLRSFNATKAAIEAGYSEKTAYSIGSELLKKPEIAARVRERFEQDAMSANEVLFHLAQIARGDMGDYVSSTGEIDLTLAFETNKTSLLKHISQRTITTEQSDIVEWDVEPYDRTRALELIGKHLGLFNTVKIEDWRTQAIADIRAGKIPYEALADAFDESLAAELFAAAGVSVSIGTGTE